MEVFKDYPHRSFNYRQLAAKQGMQPKAAKSLIDGAIKKLIKEEKIVAVGRGSYKMKYREVYATGVVDMATNGNAYIVITNRDRQGYPSELYNVHPDDVTIQRNNGAVLYTVINQGKDEKPLKRYTSKNPTGSIVHIKAFADGDDTKE